MVVLRLDIIYIKYLACQVRGILLVDNFICYNSDIYKECKARIWIHRIKIGVLHNDLEAHRELKNIYMNQLVPDISESGYSVRTSTVKAKK